MTVIRLHWRVQSIDSEAEMTMSFSWLSSRTVEIEEEVEVEWLAESAGWFVGAEDR